MAKNLFNEAIAEYLNKNFIPIKVDKEECPDIDKTYQLFAQVTGKQGGWPLSILQIMKKIPFLLVHIFRWRIVLVCLGFYHCLYISTPLQK